MFRSHHYRADSDDWGTADELEERFSQTCGTVRSALQSIGRGRWPLFDRPPLKSWVRNRIALLGDAAHPMLQYLAQGACQASEDALVLADVLSKAPNAIPSALRE